MVDTLNERKTLPPNFFLIKTDLFFCLIQWDIIALSSMLGVLGWLAWGVKRMTIPSSIQDKHYPFLFDPRYLPRYVGLTVLRMLIALLFFTHFYLFWWVVSSSQNEIAARLIIPFIDMTTIRSCTRASSFISQAGFISIIFLAAD